MASHRQKRLKMRRKHASQVDSVKLDNSSAEVIQMDNYKGVKGMKKKIAKIIGRIKKFAKDIVNWVKKEDVQLAAIGIGFVGSVAFASYTLGQVSGMKKIMKEVRPLLAKVRKFGDITTIYVALMDAFLNETPERWESFEIFRDNWKIQNNIGFVQ